MEDNKLKDFELRELNGEAKCFNCGVIIHGRGGKWLFSKNTERYFCGRCLTDIRRELQKKEKKINIERGRCLSGIKKTNSSRPSPAIRRRKATGKQKKRRKMNKQIWIRIEKEKYEKLKKTAEKNGIKISELVRNIIEVYIEGNLVLCPECDKPFIAQKEWVCCPYCEIKYGEEPLDKFIIM